MLADILRRLEETIPLTVGNHALKKTLGEIADEVENLQLERDDAIEELLQQREL